MSKLLKLKVKLVALVRCLRFSGWGADARSRWLMFCVGVIASIYPSRRKWVLRLVESSIQRAAEGPDNVVTLRLNRPLGARRQAPVSVKLRGGNRADYQSMWECLAENIYPAPTSPIHYVIDGGANIGFFSLILLGLTDLRSVIVIEPNPSNLELLRQNVSLLPSEIIEVALSGEDGTARFDVADSNTGHLNSAPHHAQSTEAIVVPSKRLTTIAPPDWDMDRTWLKLDIEGSEYEVLRDMLKSPLRPKSISVEIHEYPTAGGAQLVQELKAAGYSITMLNPGDQANVCRQISAEYQSPTC